MPEQIAKLESDSGGLGPGITFPPDPAHRLGLDSVPPDDVENGVWSRLSLHEFLVDFLGGLVPGVLFLAASTFAIVPALATVGFTIDGDMRPLAFEDATLRALAATKETPSAIWVGLFVLALMLSYVLGMLFYRRDPKIPDRVSLHRLLRDITRTHAKEVLGRTLVGLPFTQRLAVRFAWNGMVCDEYEARTKDMTVKEKSEATGFVYPQPGLFTRWTPPQLKQRAKNAWQARCGSQPAEADDVLVRNKQAWSDYGCATPQECEFPYPHLSAYLYARNQHHLVAIAKAWEEARSKTHINRLKIRLSYKRPEKYRPIVRNEAHVRLATSTWYMAQALQRLTYLALAVLAGVGIASHAPLADAPHAWLGAWPTKELIAWLFAPSVPSLLVLGLAHVSRNNCEHFIHYQRLREAFYVLELAYTATNPKLGILDATSATSATTVA